MPTLLNGLTGHLLAAGDTSVLRNVVGKATVAPGEDLSAVGEEVITGSYMHIWIFFGAFTLASLAIFGFCWLMAWSQQDKPYMSGSRLQRYAAVLGIADPDEEQATGIVPDAKTEEGGGIWDILKSPFNVFLVFVPLGWASHYLHWGDTTIFFLNLGAMLPLANLMGVATEELSCHTGQAIGGLLNATFGNAVELIVVVQSIRNGMLTVTKGTILGSMLANELLVLGMAMFFGGLFEKGSPGKIARNKQQSFSKVGAMVQAQLLLFSAFSICMPSMFKKAHNVDADHVVRLSRLGSLFTLVAYTIFLVFQLYTHREMIAGSEAHGDQEEEEVATVSAASASGLLVGATLMVALSSEFLVHAIEGFTAECGFSQTFVGVVLIPIIGNACEHSTAVVVALKDKLTLSIGIALGSTIQIALFVCPFAVITGWVLDQPMDLDFHRVNSWALVLSALLVVCVLTTGKSNWLNGFVLIVAYLVLSVMYFFSPDDALA